jgi:hypothetical protein
LVVVTFAVGVNEEDVVGKQDGADFKRDVEVPEEEVFEKQDVAGSNGDYGGSEEGDVRKQEGAVRIHIRWWQQ